MNRKIFNFFEIAARIASKNRDRRRFFIGAVGIRGDGTMVTAFNGSADSPNRTIHAERRLVKKLDYGATVYVARIKMGDGEFGNARPCVACQKALKSRQVKRVYYTLGPDEYGILYLEDLGNDKEDID